MPSGTANWQYPLGSLKHTTYWEHMGIHTDWWKISGLYSFFSILACPQKIQGKVFSKWINPPKKRLGTSRSWLSHPKRNQVVFSRSEWIIRESIIPLARRIPSTFRYPPQKACGNNLRHLIWPIWWNRWMRNHRVPQRFQFPCPQILGRNFFDFKGA